MVLYPTRHTYEHHLLDLAYSTSRLIGYVRTSGLAVLPLIGKAIDGLGGLLTRSINVQLVGNSGIPRH